jgi:vitamin B12 transporter
MKKKLFFVAAVIFSSYASAQQDKSAKDLDEVIITANRIEQKQSQTGKVVTVVSQEVLKKNAGKTLTEILNLQAGIFINGANNNLGSNQDFYFRGAGTANVLIMIDGVPVSDPSQINNSYDLNNINLSQIEKIEILKGAQSTLWGSDATAGVVNIITKKDGSKMISPNVLLSYGSYGTFRGNAGINGKTGKFSYNLNYAHTNSRGFSAAYDSIGNKNFDKDRFTQNNFQANLGYQFNNKFSAHYTANYGQYISDIDAAAFTDDNDARAENINFLNSLGFTYKTKNARLNLNQSIITSNRTFLDDSTDIGGFSTDPSAFYMKWARGNYEGQSSITELYGNVHIGSHFSVVGGVQYLNQNTAQSYMNVSNFGPFESTPIGADSAKANNLSFYASGLLSNIKGFNVEAGFRINKHSIYGTNATYTINPSYNIDDNTRIFINISSGYRIPSLYQLYSEYGNKDLKPEESLNYEIGIQAFSNSKRNNFRIVAFKRDINNLIVFFTNPNTWFSNYINRDKQNDYGFELESSIAIGKNGSWLTNLTYVDGEGTVNNTKIRNLFRRPNLMLNSVLTLQPAEKLTLMPSFRFVGTRAKGLFDAGPSLQSQYYNIDFYASYDFSKKVRVFVDFRNITDQQYFDVVGYNSRQFNLMSGIVLNF